MDDISIEDQHILDEYFELKEQESYKEAFDILYPLRKKYPENYVIFFLLGSVLYLMNDFQQATDYLKKAISLNPGHALSSLCLIHSLCNLNKWNTAFHEIRRFLSLNSKNRNEHELLIQELYETIDNFSTAERDLVRKLKHDFLKSTK